MGDWFVQYGFWLFQGAGILAVLIGVHFWIKFLRCAKFPEAAGTLETASVDRCYSSNQSSDGGGYSYYARMTYSYAVEGESFRSQNVYSIGNRGYATPGGAERVVARFPVGQSAPVYYDPKKPSSSFLINGTRMMIVMPLVFGIVFFAIGVVAQRHASPQPRHPHRLHAF